MIQPYSGKEMEIWRGRISALMIAVFFITLGILISFFNKSVLGHKQYLALAENQRTVKEVLPYERGKIYAADTNDGGEYYPLATNQEKYAVNLVPKNIKDKREVAKQLAPILEMSEEDIFNTINNDKLYIPPLKHRLDKTKADQITALNLKSVLVLPESIRYYPENSLAAQVLGFVNTEGKGNYGIEGYYDDILKGQSGLIVAEKDTRGRWISIGGEVNATDGADLVLSIDHNVQYSAEQILAKAMEKFQADDGTLIVMDPKTGKILAMAANPSFDPNAFNEVPQDKQNLFINPSISYTWEPGSIFKPIIMSAALNEGKVEPDTEGYFSNMTVVQGYEIHTAQDKAFGKETMTQVLENSDNVAMVWLAGQLGNETIYKYLEDYGFGQKIGIDLAGETSGTMMELKSWKDINRATMSFGQGISVTPLQLITAISAIANNGIMMKPYLVDRIIRPSKGESVTQPQELKKVITEDSAKELAAMMVSVVERGHGKKAQVNGFKVAGKTGTAQIPKPSSEGGGYYEDRHVGSFAGFLPAEDPKFAILVKLTNPKNTEWAESSAAPTFGEMASWLVNYYQLTPSQ